MLRLTDNYEKHDRVGEGAYGVVFWGTKKREMIGNKRARNQDIYEDGEIPDPYNDIKVAIKQIRYDDTADNDRILYGGIPLSAFREVRALKLLRGHDNIIRIDDVMYMERQQSINKNNTSPPPGQNVYTNDLFIIMEHCICDLRCLHTHVFQKKMCFTLSEVKCIMRQILVGLDYVHKKGVIHRDIHPGNILISSNGMVKIADFGLACINEPAQSSYGRSAYVVAGSYRAPELVVACTEEPRRETMIYGPEVDIWSAGCIFCELLSGKPAFHPSKKEHLLASIFKKTGTPTRENWPDFEATKHVMNMVIDGIVPPEEIHKFNKKMPIVKPNMQMLLSNSKKDRIVPECESCIHLIKRMLTLDPKKRISAADALNDELWKMDPIYLSNVSHLTSTLVPK